MNVGLFKILYIEILYILLLILLYEYSPVTGLQLTVYVLDVISKPTNLTFLNFKFS